MNKIAKAFTVTKTSRQAFVPQTFSITEKITDKSQLYHTPETVKEYAFEARFGSKHFITDEAFNDTVDILSVIRCETLRRVNNEIFGEYVERLRSLYIELHKKGDRDLALEIEDIIKDMLET